MLSSKEHLLSCAGGCLLGVYYSGEGITDIRGPTDHINIGIQHFLLLWSFRPLDIGSHLEVLEPTSREEPGAPAEICEAWACFGATAALEVDCRPHVGIYTYIHTCICIDVCKYINMHMQIYIYIYIYRMYMSVHVCISIRTCITMYMYMYIHIYKSIYLYIVI